jgi:hypothetical protein
MLTAVKPTTNGPYPCRLCARKASTTNVAVENARVSGKNQARYNQGSSPSVPNTPAYASKHNGHFGNAAIIKAGTSARFSRQLPPLNATPSRGWPVSVCAIHDPLAGLLPTRLWIIRRGFDALQPLSSSYIREGVILHFQKSSGIVLQRRASVKKKWTDTKRHQSLGYCPSRWLVNSSR